MLQGLNQYQPLIYSLIMIGMMLGVVPFEEAEHLASIYQGKIDENTRSMCISVS